MTTLNPLPPDGSLHFRFYDVGVRLVSAYPGYFDLFAQIFGRFQVCADSPPAPYTVDAAILSGNKTHTPRLRLNSEEWPLVDPLALRDHLYETIFAAVAAHVRSHILIHAAVVERNGRAFIIAGDSQHGKSSLALGLLHRGFRLLSDELAAMARSDGAVYPFLRKVRATPRSLAMAGYEIAPDDFPLWLGKYLVDVERLQIESIETPIPISDIILLHDPARRREAEQETVRLTVERVDDAWLDALRAIEGVVALDVDHSNGFPVVIIQTRNKVAVLSEADALCQKHRLLCLDMQKRSPRQPDFSQAPRLTSLLKSAAVLELLSHFQGAHTSVILQEEHGGSATSFFMEVADLVQATRCHRLAVGHYEQALDLLCHLSS